MIRPNWKLVVFAIVVVAILLTTVQSANAWWWGCCRPAYWGCGYSCYSPCYSVCSPSCGYYVGCYRPWRWSCGWCGGCYSGCYASCYSSCNVAASCCGSTTTTAAPSTPTLAPTPAKKPVIEGPSPVTPAVPDPGTAPTLTPGAFEPAAPSTTPATPPEPASTSTQIPETSGVVTVWVPYEAKVAINGLATRSTGSRRQFVSYGLKPGFSYKYNIHAEVVRDGKLLEESQIVTLTAGQSTAVAFGFNPNPAESVASAN
jgi:uncharacterized protein (TIGR03000 family)